MVVKHLCDLNSNIMIKKHILVCAILCMATVSNSQIVTSEDSLANGLIAGSQRTIISGYGESRASYDIKNKDANATLKRAVLFVGHKFNTRIILFTEMELEDAVVADAPGELSMEQAFLKFDINSSTYFVAGLFTPRIGIINENHLPTTYNGTERPYVETLIIPATWRGLGIGYYGNSDRLRGLNYSLSLTNGMNSEHFENGSGIREGRQEGGKVRGTGLMLNGSLLYYYRSFRIQFSSSMSGTTAKQASIADTLHLQSGSFANPVFVNEVNVQYRHKGIECKVLACMVNLPDAANINQTFGNNTATRMLGTYAELSYDLLVRKATQNTKAVILFIRAEYLDMNQRIPNNATFVDMNRKSYLIAGLTYKPVRGVAIKMDYTGRLTGKVYENLPFGTASYKNGFINVGLGYNF